MDERGSQQGVWSLTTSPRGQQSNVLYLKTILMLDLQNGNGVVRSIKNRYPSLSKSLIELSVKLCQLASKKNRIICNKTVDRII